MENKTLSRALFGVTVVLFIISFYFFYGMMTNGAPKDYDAGQLGLELYNKKEATSKDYLIKGEELYKEKISKIDSHILTGVNYMAVVLFLAGGLMVVFLLWGLISTLMTDFKKGIPSLIFVGISILAFIFAFVSQGPATLGADAQASNFWVYGLLFVLIPGAILLVVDLILGIVRGYTK